MSPHQGYVQREMERRVEALRYVIDPSALAEYIGGHVEFSADGRWMIMKEVFPGVNTHIIYEPGDKEFPASLRVLYSGGRVKIVPGEDLAQFAVAYVNHVLRYVREANPGVKLPQICQVV